MSLVEPGTFRAPAGAYLLSHSIGLPLGDAHTHLAGTIFDMWENDPARAWPHWLDEIDRFRRALAHLLNHRPEWFCPQVNVSSALTKILHALPVSQPRRTILLSAHAFPSLGFVAERAARVGYDLELIPRNEDTRDPDLWANHLTDDVGIVVITHVHSATGEQVPVPAVVGQARQSEIVSIVDIAQSAGVLPIDLTAWNPDFVVGSCVKWLCGGPGAGYLWANPEIIDRCEPVDVGWFSHADPFELDIQQFRYADDALRFWGGSPSVIPASIARRSIELLNQVGIDKVRAHNLALTDQLIADIAEITDIDGGMVASPRRPADRGGTVVIDAGPNTDSLLERFIDARVHVDRRASGIRVSPHLYNTSEDIDAVTAILQSLRREDDEHRQRALGLG
jgi:selenocysteine lyase/cysteine desulfurase